jgi:uncharacterized protein
VRRRPAIRVPRAALPALLALLAAVSVAALEVPYLSGRVVDEAGMVPPETAARIEEKLAAYERETGTQVAVLTIPTLGTDEVLEDYSLRVAETWQLGRGDFDDGALLLVVRDDRKMRLEVGYGLEPRLTDLASRRILDDVMRPRFRAGDFGGGIEAGVDAVIAVLENGESALPPPETRGPGSGTPLPGCIFILLLVLFFILAITGRLPWWLIATGMGRGGGGGFSGGGGSFGGGGASSSW